MQRDQAHTQTEPGGISCAHAAGDPRCRLGALDPRREAGINDRGSPPDMQRLDTLRAIAYAAQPGDYTWAEDICGAFKLVRVVGWQIPLLASAVLGMVWSTHDLHLDST